MTSPDPDRPATPLARPGDPARGRARHGRERHPPPGGRAAARASRRASSRRPRAACCSARTPSRSGRLGRGHDRGDAAGARGLPPDHGHLRRRPLPRGGDERRARGRQPRHLPRPRAPAHRDRRGGHRRLGGEPPHLPGGPRGAARPRGPRRAGDALLVEVGGGSADISFLRTRRARSTRAPTRSARSACARTSPPGTAATSSGCASSTGTSTTSSRTSAARCRCARRATSSPSAATRASPPTRSSGDDAEHRRARRSRASASCRSATQTVALDDEQLVEAYRLPLAEAETLVPALLVYRELLLETQAATVLVPEATLRAGLLLDMVARRRGPRDRGLLAARCWPGRGAGREVPLRRAARAARRAPGRAPLRRAARRARPRRARPAAAGGGGAAARHRHLREPARPPQARAVHPLGVRDLRPVAATTWRSSRTSPATTGAAAPSKSHLPYMALDSRRARAWSTSWRAILRVANALDADHLQKVRDVRVLREDDQWVLEVDGGGRPDPGAARGARARRPADRGLRPQGGLPRGGARP